MAGATGDSCKATQLAAVLLLLAVVVHPTASVSTCSVKGITDTLKISETGYGYFRTKLENVQIRVQTKYSKECINDLSKAWLWYQLIKRPVSLLLHIDVSQLIPTSVKLTSYQVGPWYKVSYITCDDKIHLKIGSRVTELVMNKEIACSPQYIEFYIKDASILCPSSMEYNEDKNNCSEVATLLPLDATNSSSTSTSTEKLLELFSLIDEMDKSATNSSFTPTSTESILDTRRKFLEPKNGEDNIWSRPSYGDENSNIFNEQLRPYDFQSIPTITVPSIEDRDIYKYQSHGEENAIPIFIGVMAFTLSMCMRFCLCRGKSVVRRVTTVTVIRSRPVQETQEENHHDPTLDPPPAYLDVVNETSTSEVTQEPPPPAYSDIEPPPYFELETTPEDKATESAAGHDSQDSTAQSSSDAPTEENTTQESSGAAVSSSLARVLSKVRTQQKQFSFKPLEEDD